MPVAIVLRTALSKSFYRDAIVRSLSCGVGNYAVLCSGFFQENFKRSLYRASSEPGFAASMVANRVQIDLVGIHNNTWRSSYVSFARNLHAAGVNVVPYIVHGFKWHAKIYVLKNRNTPVLTIVGSSNITANAFGVANTPPLATDSPVSPRYFNYECDVYLWNENNITIDTVMENVLDVDPGLGLVVRTRYDEEDNDGKGVEDVMLDVEKQIFAGSKLSQLEWK